MEQMTEEEAARLDEEWTKNPPKPGPNGTGFFARRKAALAAERSAETSTIKIDKFTADHLITKAKASRMSLTELISKMVHEKVAAASTPPVDQNSPRC